ncbi:hypothetical protein [Amycolatopsis magusensis]|uniref:Transcriptional regulator with XRE-family HTH domain n=1 Tax=Amycolatopsis magusensis TaxID=882444 RepID=A0ABS4PXM1_9PSEU|nr:hypothetical protein [Amycolatopsis magusensis]MBP2183593.1 transcriptional regulator with XRE-family HTH domain [Amycolatopsis magusensis]MDI5982057.1 hypothetical protein [Amycolatopsis magusensis]
MSEQGEIARAAARVRTVGELAAVLNRVRRGNRAADGRELTYRDLAAVTGIPHTTIGTYLSGKVLAPADRFDLLITALGAPPALSQALATARDRVADQRLGTRAAGEPDRSGSALSAVAHQSLGIADLLAGGAGDDTLGWLEHQIRRCSVDYSRLPAEEIVPDLIKLHRTVLGLLNVHMGREQSRRLFFCCGLSGYLLASASHDRMDWVTAGRQAEAALVFADRAGNSDLRALIHNIQSLSHMLRGRPAAALRYASAGVTAAKSGGMSVLLPLREARAFALLRRTDDAYRVLRTVERVRERAVPSDFDEALGYTEENAEQTYLGFLAEAFAALPPSKESLPAAERHARNAVDAYPDPRDCVWAADRAAISHLLLATAQAHQDRLDAVEPAVEPVLALPRWRRNADLRHAAGNLRSAVRSGGTRDPRRVRLSRTLADFSGDA